MKPSPVDRNSGDSQHRGSQFFLCDICRLYHRWWDGGAVTEISRCVCFHPPVWGWFPCWLVFFEGVETTNSFWFEFILFGKRQTWRKQKTPQKLKLIYLSKILEDSKINGRFFKGLTCRVESHWLVELDADLWNPFDIRKVAVFEGKCRVKLNLFLILIG